eukprot:CAMPEP_0194131650 /NCGR_PEP_ID=MMETSP0152-20130528/2378_1 /TAXON_ID=1049557 /ORGANISM="Thalassiothrix antarctica, Strain L6-D1" /LENGTH=214 /DNA_ID=CAMNT_0038826501 /DNA_START=122 /DNA_END=766 /DNA_ORIENTATION=-
MASISYEKRDDDNVAESTPSSESCENNDFSLPTMPSLEHVEETTEEAIMTTSAFLEKRDDESTTKLTLLSDRGENDEGSPIMLHLKPVDWQSGYWNYYEDDCENEITSLPVGYLQEEEFAAKGISSSEGVCLGRRTSYPLIKRTETMSTSTSLSLSPLSVKSHYWNYGSTSEEYDAVVSITFSSNQGIPDVGHMTTFWKSLGSCCVPTLDGVDF